MNFSSDPVPASGDLVLTGQLIGTKFYRPRVRHALVARPRLNALLDQASPARLTLISAPAGFGKTTLLTAWLAAGPSPDRSVAWLSLDRGDGRPGTFWTYVITALQSAVPGLGAEVLPLLQVARPPVETVLVAVLNELSVAPNDVTVVLDDYHQVDGPSISSGLSFLLDHLPPQIHLVLSSRADPALPLARLRARGELVEIRAADLRFTLGEVSAYLNEVVGLNLAASAIATLEGRTEGWIAALQLAAMSMRGRDDVSDFVAAFAGDDRFVVDYLVQEVLRGQSERVRTFLLRTCLLDRLTGPLCDAVTGESGGQAMLERLDRANLFVVPLDDRRCWYRYHHLFADMLRMHLRDERADEITDLHRRASLWYDGHGQPEPAVRHALEAGDVDRAADLVQRASPELRRNRQEATIRAWLDLIPDAVVRRRPVLTVDLVSAMMAGNEFDGVEERLRDAERRLELDERAGPASDDSFPVDPTDTRRLPGVIELSRAGLALVGGDLAATLGHARLAIDRACADDHVTRAGASALCGLAHWTAGDLSDAHRAYTAAIEGLRRDGHLSDALGCSIALADIRSTQGRLDDALDAYERGRQLALAGSGPVPRGTADMHVGLGRIVGQRGELEDAERSVRRSQDLGEHLGLPQNRYRTRVAQAEVCRSRGDLAGALRRLDQADEAYVGDFSPNVRPVPAMRARVLAALGQVPRALNWAREHGLTVHDEPSYRREFEHIVLAAVLLADRSARPGAGRLLEISQLLERLASAADTGGRTGSVIEIGALQAITHRAAGNLPAALAHLERALELAERPRYVQVFLDEGPPMIALLQAIGHRRPGWAYVHELLDIHARNDGRDRHRPAGSPVRGGPGIVERHTHTKSIYAKLGVSGRRAAVRQAEELDLIPRGR